MVNGAVELVVAATRQFRDAAGESYTASLEEIRLSGRQLTVERVVSAEETMVEQAGVELDIVVVERVALIDCTNRLAYAKV